MSLFTEGTISFIVRLWLEQREVEGASPEWRGYIEHVQTGEHAYFRELNALMQFIEEKMNTRFPPEER